LASPVGDVVGLHLCARTHPVAKRERLLAAAGDFMSMLAIANGFEESYG
jgi:hypothetical protein